jgi:simple sugar transport system permease protein
VIVSAQTGNPFLGLLAATASGALLGLLFSWSITRLGANEIVAGLGLNLLVLGFFGYLLPTVFKIEGTLLPAGLVGLPKVHIPLVEQIPGIGPIVSGHDVVTYLSWLSVPLVSLFLYRTPLGIQLRATGANEEAARAAGVPTLRLRDFSTVVAGALAGLAGAQLSLGVVTLFNKTMTGGRGFIALAAFYFGDARPAMTALGAVIFGVFEAAGFRLGSSGIPSQLVQMLPYLVVVISLTLVAVRRELRLRERGRAAAASLSTAVVR